jgi:TRAP-type C4-dicarboxylate transport system permease small subunit
MVLWVGFVGASLAARENRHIAIDFLPNILPASWHRPIGIFTKLCAAVISLFLAQAAWSFVAYEREAESILFLNLPVWIFQVVLPYSFGLLTIRFILSAIDDLLSSGRQSQ